MSISFYVPNARLAVIDTLKISNYLLNIHHERGGGKAKLLLMYGYTLEDWQRLESDIREYHLNSKVSCVKQTEYGTRYEIVAPLETPSGKSLIVRTVWQVDLGQDYPRFITLVPD